MKVLKLLAVFALIYLEFSLFVFIANSIGVLMTIVSGFLSTLIGISLVKKQGLRHFQLFQARMTMQNDLVFELVKGFTLLIAGLLLLIPGFITDLFGLLLLIPYVQRQIHQYYARKIKVHPLHSHANYTDDNTFDGQYTRTPEQAPNQLEDKTPKA